ncbi:pyridoxal-phosphate dependent enzyme [candidate division CSSED10-310 bacterium]|uniref:Pyridoxal-phosphate dependent enzyme n=1 Tax=candidate division CSSED10-310 bacterium TaxID=2855610 RepID=A0ABV6YV66_UNCC1
MSDSLQKKDDRVLEKGFELMDGATGDLGGLSNDVADNQIVSANVDYSLEERLEAYEDIIDSEVGDTMLVRARNMERETGVRQLYLKFEGGNPTGSQKDRIAFAQAMDALRRGFDAITVATCGNYGAALSLAASLAGIRCIIFILEQYHTKRIAEMINFKADIRKLPGNYEDVVEISREYAEKHEVYDANPGGANTALQLKAYGEIAYEIYDELRDAPKAIAVPVSNGTTLAGIYTVSHKFLPF